MEEYNEYLDNPKLLISPWRSVRLFDNTLIETVTMGPWYMTPIACIPIICYFLSCAQSNMLETAIAFCFGMIMWSFFEYSLHRHLFHAERSWLPDHPFLIACHFVLNGIHHAYPQDAFRTTFPVLPLVPVLYVTMWTPVRFCTPDYYEDALLAGLMAGYMIYEQWHYFTHFGQTSSRFLKTLKKDHMHHHYR